MVALNKFTVCAICNEICVLPKSLSCYHTFCHDCLDRMFTGISKSSPYMYSNGSKESTVDWDYKVESCSGDCPLNLIDMICPVCSVTSQIPAIGPSALKINRLIEKINSSEGLLVTDHNEKNSCNTCYELNNQNFTLQDKSTKTSGYYCSSCDQVTCHVCIKDHNEHDFFLLDNSFDKKVYLNELLSQSNISKCNMHILENQICNSIDTLSSSCDSVIECVNKRFSNIIAILQEKKKKLLEEIEILRNEQIKKFKDKYDHVIDIRNKFDGLLAYCETLITYGDAKDILTQSGSLENEIFDNIKQSEKVSCVDLINVKFQVPEKSDFSIDKLFGSVLQGVINCGDAKLLKSVQIDMNWPIALTITKNQNMLVAGKTGALDQQGRIDCYKDTTLLNSFILPENVLPFDAIYLKNDMVAVTNNCGHVMFFSSDGSLKHTSKSVFKGSGGIVCNNRHELVVTSSDESKIHVISESNNIITSHQLKDENGQSIHPHCVTINSLNEYIVTDTESHSVFCYDESGTLKFFYKGCDLEENSRICPSYVCCDPFDNILISDFINDRIHLLSKSGKFLGYLLTKTNNIACPNFLTLNNDGHLFVGQYGGEIAVFDYLSYVKHV